MREAAALCQLRSDTVYVLVAGTGVLSADFGSLIGWIDRCISKEPRVEGRA